VSNKTYAIIGVGAAVFRHHEKALAALQIRPIAVSDINTLVGRRRAEMLGCTFYADPLQLLKEMHPDVVVILTPHPLHATLALESLQAGSHVLVEKPMAVQIAEADAMVEMAQRQRRLLGVVFQHRFHPEIRAASQLIREGHIGDIQHVEVTAVWPRTADYYRLSPWRGTWAGEGGGVLMNQAPHHLDLLCYLVGQPGRVFSWTRRLRHAIEAEDTVQASLEWPGGALGSLHISTAELDMTDTIKIVGTKGMLEIHQCGAAVNLYTFNRDARAFAEQSQQTAVQVTTHTVPLKLDSGGGTHIEVYRDFHQALLNGTPLQSSGRDGRLSLELANALIYSSFTHKEVELPLDRQQYEALLARLRRDTVLSLR